LERGIGSVASVFEKGAVVGQPEADSAGVNVLKKGGNAVDAAVTSALLSCVLAPNTVGIAGYGGMMLVCRKGEVRCIDFNTVAPEAASARMFEIMRSDGRFGSAVKNRANEIGPLAISVPGVLAGLDLALREFGTLGISDALAPAIRASQNGFRVSAGYAEAVAENERTLRANPDTAKLHLVDDALPTTTDRGKNPDLAKLLQQVEKNGVDEFYRGRIATRIVNHMEKVGGTLTKEDLASYQAQMREPIHTSVMGFDIYTPPLCSSGLSLLQMCRIAEAAEIDLWERDAARLAHAMTESLRAAWLDRYRYFGDPNHVQVPLDLLLSDAHLTGTGREVAEHVSAGTQGQCLLRPLAAGGTTHISVIDDERTMVSLSLTHGPEYGSCVTIPRAGLTMNGGMSRFDPGSGLPNSIAPGKAPLVNLCPTLVLREGEPVMSLGASGGTRITSSLFQVLARRLVMGEDLAWAVSAPRVHGEGNDWVMVEEEFGEIAPEYLESVKYTVRSGEAAARVRALEVDESGGLLTVYDPRMKAREKGY